MGKAMLFMAAAALAVIPATTTLNAIDLAPPIVVDHTCADISQIQLFWIQSIQSQIKIYYGHQSHGWQVTTGLNVIQYGNPAYADSAGYKFLPSVPGSLCIYDVPDMLPEDYWSTAAGMNKTRNVLRNDPSINVSMFCWCNQMDGLSASYVQAYFDSLSRLEAEFPNVTFVYMTGNANSTGWEGYNRQLRNEQIRQYCTANNKVLFDFADLDTWWFNPDSLWWEQATYTYEGTVVPVQHPQYVSPQCDICGHANRTSCIRKGNALWSLLVSIGDMHHILTGVEHPPAAAALLDMQQNFPNPFDGSTSIGFTLNGSCRVTLQIFSVAGQLVATICNNKLEKGTHAFTWNGLDNRGRVLPNGIYFCRLTGPGGVSVTKKMMKLR